ncbi:MAG: SpvB/TcaC N-terminal domain-containing protein [Leptolyngbyaceae cyanobacterium]
MPASSKEAGNGQASDSDKSYYSPPPAVTLPKGGGAIKGMGEKFAANPVTGTGSMTVPIATSPGRSGFGPQLSLSYDSGAGNGSFGFGWSLSLPAITRKTDKGIPRYQDDENSDVFILSGAEDLVPTGEIVPFQVVNGITYSIQRYRPRVEGLFARIECWKADSGETHWRSMTRDNITTIYGKDNSSRIFDPKDLHPEHPTRVFSWLICESYDDRETINDYYERNPDDPRVAHQMTLEVDEFGNVLKSVAIAYPRRHPLHPEQAKPLITYTENQVANKPDKAAWYRIGVHLKSCESGYDVLQA